MGSIMIGMEGFGGRRPKIDPTKLPNNVAQTATNCDRGSGSLKGLRGVTLVEEIGYGTAKTLWKKGSSWIVFDDDVEASVVNAQVDESDNRFFWTGDSFPKKSDDTQWATATPYKRLGIVAPSAALTATPAGVGNGEIQAVISYVYTCVSEWGEESAPSPATATQTIEGNQTVNLTNINTPTGNNNTISYKRIYRIAVGSAGAEYMYLAQIAEATTIYADDDGANAIKDCQSDVLPSEDWDPPPTDLEYLTQAHNGMLVGASGKELYVSEPYVPYAYNSGNALAFDSDIQGIGTYNEAIIVITEAYCYVVTGATPEALFANKIDQITTCVSNRGVVTTPIGCAFPSDEGLCICDGTKVVTLTWAYMTPAQWQALGPENLLGTYYDNKYVGFLSGSLNGITFDLEKGEFENFTLSSSFDATFNGLVDGDFSDGGSSQYTSDFSGGADGWTASSATVTGVQTIGGQANSLKFDTMTFRQAYADSNQSVTSGEYYTVTFKYYVPSGNTYLDGIKLLVGSTPITGVDAEETQDAWTTVSYSFAAPATGDLCVWATDGGITVFGSYDAGDYFGIYDFQISTAGFSDWVPSDDAITPVGGGGINVDGTQAAAITMSQPYIDFENECWESEEDTGGFITPADGNTVNVNADQDVDCYWYRDMGDADYFDSDVGWIHYLDLYVDSASTGGRFAPYIVNGSSKELKDTYDANDDHVAVWVDSAGGATFALDANFYHDGNFVNGDAATLSVDTQYYLELELNPNIGTYGTFYVRIYSSAARTTATLVDTITATLASATALELDHVGMGGWNDGSGGNSVVCVIENFSIYEKATVDIVYNVTVVSSGITSGSFTVNYGGDTGDSQDTSGTSVDVLTATEKSHFYLEFTSDFVGKIESIVITSVTSIAAIYDVYHEATDDIVYMLTYNNKGFNYVHSYDTNSTRLTYTWKSKEFVDKEKYTCAKIKGEQDSNDTIEFKLYYDGTLVQTSTISNEKLFRLINKSYSRSVEFQVESDVQIDFIQLASDPQELI